jgi:hypothetical protein
MINYLNLFRNIKTEMKIILIERNSDIKETSTKNKLDMKELYKKCKFRNANDFDKRATWSFDGSYISIYAKDSGKSKTENKTELPPPIDTPLYFGSILVLRHSEEEITETNVIDMTKDIWDNFYEKSMGGSESLGDEDSYSEEEIHPEEDLTKDGYLKDGFVVDDVEEEIEDDDYVSEIDGLSSGESDELMTQEELEAAYGVDSEEEEDIKNMDDYGEEEDEELEDVDSELDEEEYIYK